jgi:acetylornithine deacetylase/succinyl-diaminopimelate desuccinylase-like protein
MEREKQFGLKPYILMAHQDVVPIEESTRNQWHFEPFGGTIKDGYICGRGTTDDKINLISILESAEKLLKENFNLNEPFILYLDMMKKLVEKMVRKKLLNY